MAGMFNHWLLIVEKVEEMESFALVLRRRTFCGRELSLECMRCRSFSGKLFTGNSLEVTCMRSRFSGKWGLATHTQNQGKIIFAFLLIVL